mmetsp:Transcript_38357/g.65831  ORF Transcript_38357/g.65831 Transcript_38357/m.65831 type:complete len:211 (-) Transcript_38357:404-1036(-)
MASMAALDLSGLRLSTAGLVPSFGALTLDWTSSELMRRERSELAICSCGRRYGVPLCTFSVDGVVAVPKIESSFSNADCVHTQKRPRCPPGASCSRLSALTSASSTPGMLRKARLMPLSESYTTSGPRRCTKRRLRILPLPARIVFDEMTFSTSSYAPNFLRSLTASAVLVSDSAPEETTSGTSSRPSILWPRAITSAGTPDAATADATA